MYGRSAEDVLDKVGAVLRKPVAAKYCHPENPELTLTGHGRKLSWVQALLDEGYIMADFLFLNDNEAHRDVDFFAFLYASHGEAFLRDLSEYVHQKD